MPPCTIRIATFNLRSVLDRWDERRALLVGAFRAIDPDLAGLQEVAFDGEPQTELLAGALPARGYRAFGAETRPGFGNAMLIGAGVPVRHETIDLDWWRLAHRVRVELSPGVALWLVNTHLHHLPGDAPIRARQVQRVCEWMDEAGSEDVCVVVGDFNALPAEPAYQTMTVAGFRSAHCAVHGIEPAITWPSGIQAPGMDTEGDPGCVDYVWVRGPARIAGAHVAGNQPAAGDPTLYPSDHFAVVADLVI